MNRRLAYLSNFYIELDSNLSKEHSKELSEGRVCGITIVSAVFAQEPVSYGAESFPFSFVEYTTTKISVQQMASTKFLICVFTL